MMNIKVLRSILVGLVVMYSSSCNREETPSTTIAGYSPRVNNLGGDWLIPVNEVFDGGPGKDGIPALEDPDKVSVSGGDFMLDEELILGFYDGKNAVAYPHQILDWHEIINDELNFVPYAIVYCPLTGSGIGWERVVGGGVTTFGVSGLLYDNNLIPYDRRTDSNWSQMRLECVNGPLIGEKVRTFQIVETRWKTWKDMYPTTTVVSQQTGYDRPYGTYPYLDYRTNENFLLGPLSIIDKRLNGKERVHGIIVDGVAKVYRFNSFPITNTLINDVVNGEEVIILGNENKNFIVSFYSQLPDGSKPVFSPVSQNNIIMEDDLGNEWDVFGYAVSGPSKGMRLRSTESFIGYWFSWGAFYPDSEIYGK
jgi:Protein of unknown function (DUF3179)